jgi:hypothetical protein
MNKRYKLMCSMLTTTLMDEKWVDIFLECSTSGIKVILEKSYPIIKNSNRKIDDKPINNVSLSQIFLSNIHIVTLDPDNLTIRINMKQNMTGGIEGFYFFKFEEFCKLDYTTLVQYIVENRNNNKQIQIEYRTKVQERENIFYPSIN